MSIEDLARLYLADTYARDDDHRKTYLSMSDAEALERLSYSDYPGGRHAFIADHFPDTSCLSCQTGYPNACHNHK